MANDKKKTKSGGFGIYSKGKHGHLQPSKWTAEKYPMLSPEERAEFRKKDVDKYHALEKIADKYNIDTTSKDWKFRAERKQQEEEGEQLQYGGKMKSSKGTKRRSSMRHSGGLEQYD